MAFSQIALNCKDQRETERYYSKNFGFKRVGVFDLGGGKLLIFIKLEDFYLELFPNAEPRQGAAQAADGGEAQGVPLRLQGR